MANSSWFPMDTVTQALLGAATSQLGFRQRIGRDAAWVAAAAAVVPDLDIFIPRILSLFGVEMDGMSQMRHHRALSHSLLFAPVLSLFLAWIWWTIRRAILRRRARPGYNLTAGAASSGAGLAPPPFWLMYLCIFAAVFSHPLLDWCTSYGTQLFAPITNKRYAIDCVPVVDMIYTPILILTLTACYIVRKINPAAAKKRTLAIAWIGFLLSVGYLGLGRFMHDKAVALAVKNVRGEKIIQADAFPSLWTVFLWRTLIETEDSWHVGRVHIFGDQPTSKKFPKTPPNLWITKAQTIPAVKTFDWFAMGRIRKTYRTENDTHVVNFNDMRYGIPAGSEHGLWRLEVIFDPAGKAVALDRVGTMTGGKKDIRIPVYQTWRDVWNP